MEADTQQLPSPGNMTLGDEISLSAGLKTDAILMDSARLSLPCMRYGNGRFEYGGTERESIRRIRIPE